MQGDNIVAKSITERTSTSELSSAVTKLLNDVIELSSDPAKRVSSIQEVTRLDEYIDKLLHAGGVPLLWVHYFALPALSTNSSHFVIIFRFIHGCE